jgi:hypothetical protein
VVGVTDIDGEISGHAHRGHDFGHDFGHHQPVEGA